MWSPDKNQHARRLLAANGVYVLIYGVRSSHVPVGTDPLHGGQDFNEFAQFVGNHPEPQPSRMCRFRESALYCVRMQICAQIGIDAIRQGDSR